MPAIAPCAPNCCTTVQTVNVPGLEGVDGVDGTNGVNAYSVITSASVAVPAIGDTAGFAVDSSLWMVIGQHVVVGVGSGGVGVGPANFVVTAVPTTTSCTLMFLGYPGDVAPGASILASEIISPAGGFGGGWNILSKTADESRINNDVLSNDATLQFYMLASTKYRLRGAVFYDTTAAGDMKYAFTGPAAPTIARFERIDCVAGAAPAERAIDVVIPASTALAGGGTTGGYIKFDAVVQNGVNAATFAFQFAQDTATADTGAIVRAGSWMEWSIA